MRLTPLYVICGHCCGLCQIIPCVFVAYCLKEDYLRMRLHCVPPQSLPGYRPSQDSINARAAQREQRANARRSIRAASRAGVDDAKSPPPNCCMRQWTSLKQTLYQYSYFSSSVVAYSIGLSVSHIMVYTQNNVQVSDASAAVLHAPCVKISLANFAAQSCP